MFDTASGKMIPSPSLNVQETSTGVQFTEPKALLVEFGTLVGKNPKEAAGVTTVLRTGKSTCQFNKTDLLDSTYDRNIKVRTQSAQIEFFRKACVGTPISFTAQAEPSAPVRAPKPSRIGVDFLTKDQEDFDLPTDFGQSKGSQ